MGCAYNGKCGAKPSVWVCRFTVIGNTGMDPEMTMFDTGACVARVSLAVRGKKPMNAGDPMGTNADDGATTWLDVEAWNDEARQLCDHVGRRLTPSRQRQLQRCTPARLIKPRSQVTGIPLRSDASAGCGRAGGADPAEISLRCAFVGTAAAEASSCTSRFAA